MAFNPYQDEDDNQVVTTNDDYKKYIAAAAQSKRGTVLGIYGQGAYAALADAGDTSDNQALVRQDEYYNKYLKLLDKSYQSAFDTQMAGMQAERLGTKYDLRNKAAANGALSGTLQRQMSAIDTAFAQNEATLFADLSSKYSSDISSILGEQQQLAVDFETNMEQLLKRVGGYDFEGKTWGPDWYTQYTTTEATTGADGNTLVSTTLNDAFRDLVGGNLFGSSEESNEAMKQLRTEDPEIYQWFLENRALIADALDLEDTNKVGEKVAYDVSLNSYRSTDTQAKEYQINVADAKELPGRLKDKLTLEKGTNPNSFKISGVSNYGKKFDSNKWPSDLDWELSNGGTTIDAKDWNLTTGSESDFKSVQDIIKGSNPTNNIYRGRDGKYYAIVYYDKDKAGKSEVYVTEVRRKEK